jgi:hypothetical protein
MIDITNALTSLKPEARWTLRGDEIEWLDDTQTQPTDSEITAEIQRLQAEYDSKQYARDRAEAYPSLTDQADMAYWDRKNGTTTLDDALDAIKAEFPKPE